MVRRCGLIATFLLLHVALGLAAGVPAFPIKRSAIALSTQPRVEQPFDVAGPHGLMVGTQDGVLESWIYPVKLLSDLRVEAELADYPVRLSLNRLAANIEVNPAYTVVTYSHIAFTVRQIMFVPRDSRVAVVIFAVDSVRPMKLHVSFVPEMKNMWPAESPGAYPGWDETNSVAVFNTDKPGLQGLVGIPGSRYEILRPYQERAEAARYVLSFDFDPKTDVGKYVPMILTVGTKPGEAREQYNDALKRLPELFGETETYFDHYFDHRTVAETPDEQFNLELKWAMLAIDKSRVSLGEEEGLIAGYHISGNTARPGFGWFFGRDTLWTLFATNGYGDFELTRNALDFLLKRQRNDGKIMHEFSQSADQVDWATLPYFYASADATPLMIVAMNDYLQHGGDVDYVRRNWEKVKLAYEYCRSHDADRDGLYDNAGSGHGWIESGPLAENFQEIYLAGVWADALEALSRMARQLGDAQLAAQAENQYQAAKQTIDREYWDEPGKRFAFGRSRTGELNAAATILPAVAMWNRLLDEKKTAPMLDEWASHVFSTDWGTRILSNADRNYDPISYHNGSVWPLFTGWVSLAEYQYGRPLAGYQHLRQNSRLTFAQDPGYVTELLSGDYFQPFPRSSPHQMWSSAMVLTPFLRGTLGMKVDALSKTATFSPQLPGGWRWVRLRNFRIGNATYDVEISRSAEGYSIKPLNGNPSGVRFRITQPSGKHASPEIAIPEPSVVPGEDTNGLRFIDYEREGNATYRLSLEGVGGRSYTFSVCSTTPLSTQGADAKPRGNCWSDLTVRFDGQGYSRKSVTLTLSKR
jgi:hypothetical protein